MYIALSSTQNAPCTLASRQGTTQSQNTGHKLAAPCASTKGSTCLYVLQYLECTSLLLFTMD